MLSEINEKLFQCNVQDPNNYIKLLHGEIEETDGQIYLSNKYVKNALFEELSFIIKYLRKQWIFIQNSILLTENVSYKSVGKAREEVNKGLWSMLHSLCSRTGWTQKEYDPILTEINSIAVSILSLDSFHEQTLMKLCYAVKQNNCPINEYIHSYLDIQCYILLLRLKCNAPKNVIEKSLVIILSDMTTLSRKYFADGSNLENSSFLCPCIKHFWFITQVIMDRQFGCDMFWDKFQFILREDNSLFSFWLLKDITNLNNIHERLNNDNNRRLIPKYDIVEEKLRNNASDHIFNHLRLIFPSVFKLWNSENRIKCLLLLWDHFSKRLNSSIKYKSLLHLSCAEFTEIVDTIVFCPQNCDEEFDLFVGMLLFHLEEVPHHWSKIKCRIFSQLSPFKVGNLEEVGIYRVFELFISLMRINSEELSKKIISVFENLKEKMITITNMNIYISFIIRHVREDKSIDKLTGPIVRILQTASDDLSNYHLVKNFFQGLELIIKFSSNMQLHQWTLLDSWLNKYLATCYFSDLEYALKIILDLVKKVEKEEVWSYWENVFREKIYVVLKQIGTTSSCPPIAGELASELSCLSSDLRNDAFSFFNLDSTNFKVTEKYLCIVLKNYPTYFSLTPSQEKIAMQSWIRICLFSTQNYEEITESIMKLESVPQCIKQGIIGSKDPLISFIETLGRNQRVFLNSPLLIKFCEMCFENLDQCLSLHLPRIKNGMVVLRIYTCLAIAVLQCGILIYDRHKISNPVTKLISCLLFPTEFLMGRTAHPFLESIRKTWHIYFEGLLKLGTEDDPYLQRTLRDLISKYLPHYSVAESPIYLCLTREISAKFVLNKMSMVYFKHPTKESEVNVTKALKILNEYIRSSTSVSLMKVVISETLFGLFDVYIFHNQRNLALSIIMYLVTCSFYDQVKEEVMKSLLLLTEKHLAFNSKTYFSLINILAKTIPSEVLLLRQSIVDKIKNIERIRGIGYDENLRSYLKTLNTVLNS